MKSYKYVYLLTAIMASPVHAVEVSKSDWINGMTTALPAAFCISNTYFRQCFDVSAQQCEETAASATRICLNHHKNEIPNTLIQPKDGTHWGEIIGSCAGEAYEAALTKSQITNEKCSNAANWL